jgi:hypothetical protein
MIPIESPLGQRVIAAQGALESGMLANMRTYRLPREPRIHVRLVGEERTLCGRSLFHNAQYAWQFINRGRFAQALPSGANDDRTCRVCASNEAVAATAAVEYARQNWRSHRSPRRRQS